MSEHSERAKLLGDIDERLVAMSRYYAHRAEDADDLAQEGRAAAWEAITGYRPGKVPATAFALVAARFAMVDWCRKEGRPGRRAGHEASPDQLGHGATPEDLVVATLSRAEQLRQLRERDQAILRGAFLGWAASDLGPLFGLSADRVRELRLAGIRALAS